MRSKNFSIGLTLVLAATFALTLLTAATHAAAQTETVLYSFNSSGDGELPLGGLIFDSAGNLYGTTADGGGYGCERVGCGTVFKLTPQAGGGWTEEILHNFNDSPLDGSQPYAGLTLDSSGNLYGTARYGGTYECGIVFRLTPLAGGSWTESILHDFNNTGADGCGIYASVLLDSAGNVYGAAEGGGTHGVGIVFELSPRTGGNWPEKILHAFGSSSTDGQYPNGLVFDSTGNLYGTTEFGGNSFNGGAGTAFELLPQTSGGWKEKIIANFSEDGSGPKNPISGLTFDPAGNLYGTSNQGGHSDGGTVFELSPNSGGSWTPKVIHSFSSVNDGFGPQSGVAIDTAGNLYGTTEFGGGSNGSDGIAYELTPHTGGSWIETILQTFTIDSPNGDTPWGPVILDSSGNVYGTTEGGGANLRGTVFEITP